MLIIPVGFALLRITPPFRYDETKAAAELATLRGSVQGYSKSGEVLFINERQLLTFGMIPNVPVVSEDEVVSLMEMAISGNRPYLTQFYQDLANHRFAAIVTHKQNLGVDTGDFIEESNMWTALLPSHCFVNTSQRSHCLTPTFRFWCHGQMLVRFIRLSWMANDMPLP